MARKRSFFGKTKELPVVEWSATYDSYDNLERAIDAHIKELGLNLARRGAVQARKEGLQRWTCCAFTSADSRCTDPCPYSLEAARNSDTSWTITVFTTRHSWQPAPSTMDLYCVQDDESDEEDVLCTTEAANESHNAAEALPPAEEAQVKQPDCMVGFDTSFPSTPRPHDVSPLGVHHTEGSYQPNLEIDSLPMSPDLQDDVQSMVEKARAMRFEEDLDRLIRNESSPGLPDQPAVDGITSRILSLKPLGAGLEQLSSPNEPQSSLFSFSVEAEKLATQGSTFLPDASYAGHMTPTFLAASIFPVKGLSSSLYDDVKLRSDIQAHVAKAEGHEFINAQPDLNDVSMMAQPPPSPSSLVHEHAPMDVSEHTPLGHDTPIHTPQDSATDIDDADTPSRRPTIQTAVPQKPNQYKLDLAHPSELSASTSASSAEEPLLKRVLRSRKADEKSCAIPSELPMSRVLRRSTRGRSSSNVFARRDGHAAPVHADESTEGPPTKDSGSGKKKRVSFADAAPKPGDIKKRRTSARLQIVRSEGSPSPPVLKEARTRGQRRVIAKLLNHASPAKAEPESLDLTRDIAMEPIICREEQMESKREESATSTNETESSISELVMTRPPAEPVIAVLPNLDKKSPIKPVLSTSLARNMADFDTDDVVSKYSVVDPVTDDFSRPFDCKAHSAFPTLDPPPTPSATASDRSISCEPCHVVYQTLEDLDPPLRKALRSIGLPDPASVRSAGLISSDSEQLLGYLEAQKKIVLGETGRCTIGLQIAGAIWQAQMRAVAPYPAGESEETADWPDKAKQHMQRAGISNVGQMLQGLDDYEDLEKLGRDLDGVVELGFGPAVGLTDVEKWVVRRRIGQEMDREHEKYRKAQETLEINKT